MENTLQTEQADGKDRQVDLIMLTVYLVNVNFYILGCFNKSLESLPTIIIFSSVLCRPE